MGLYIHQHRGVQIKIRELPNRDCGSHKTHILAVTCEKWIKWTRIGEVASHVSPPKLLDGFQRKPQSRSGRGGEKKNSQPLPELEHPITQPVVQLNSTELTRLQTWCVPARYHLRTFREVQTELRFLVPFQTPFDAATTKEAVSGCATADLYLQKLTSWPISTQSSKWHISSSIHLHEHKQWIRMVLIVLQRLHPQVMSILVSSHWRCYKCCQITMAAIIIWMRIVTPLKCRHWWYCGRLPQSTHEVKAPTNQPTNQKTKGTVQRRAL
jgi:hypothetical protein